MAGYTLQQGQCVADSIAGVGGESRGAEEWVYCNDLLQQTAHDAKGVPQDQRQVLVLLPLLAQLQQSCLPAGLRAILLCGSRCGVWALTQLRDEMVDGESSGGCSPWSSARWNGWPGGGRRSSRGEER